MQYDKLAGQETIDKLTGALKGKGYQVKVVKNGLEALESIKMIIPVGASVTNGFSMTLEQIGFIEYLKSKQHNWDNLHELILAEKDELIQAGLRKRAVFSEYYLGSVHAVVETGEFLIASDTGSQLSHVVYTSPNLIFVVSTKKIVSTIPDAFKRLSEYVVPLEERHMQEKFGKGTKPNKIVIFNGENEMGGRKIYIVLVEQDLGY